VALVCACACMCALEGNKDIDWKVQEGAALPDRAMSVASAVST
jgi:hypothetical protein